MKKNLNQKLINLIEYYNLINANFLLSDTPIKRKNENTTNAFTGTKLVAFFFKLQFLMN